MIIYCNTKPKVKVKKKTKREIEQYQAWLKRVGGTKVLAKSKKLLTSTPAIPSYRAEKKLPSNTAPVVGATTLGNQKQVYTGDVLLGIACMHKSNYVPVVKIDEAVDIAHMRR